MPVQINNNQSILVTVQQLANHPRYPWLTERAMRHYIHDAEPRFSSKGEEIGGNGLAKAICRLGRKVLIDIDEFECWVRSHKS